MKKLLILFTAFIIGNKAYTQNTISQTTQNGVISGKLTDQKASLPLPYVTINVKDKNAKSILTVISDDKGTFHLEGLPIQELDIQFSLIGYQTLNKTIILNPTAHKIDLGSLTLVQDATILNDVLVTAEKPGISLKLGKKVFEVGKDILAQSGSVNDILNSVPSVSVNPEGAVSLRGNSNVTVLINGRQSGLTQSNSLDQIPAGLIEKVEVITNPSSRYDAAGSAGIINIILKKNKNGGFNGQLKVVGGIPNETRINPSLNYKSDKLNLFSTLGIRLSDYKGFYSSNQVLTNNGLSNFLDQTHDENRHDDAKLIYLGADYLINAHNTITAAYFKNATHDHDKSLLNYGYSSNRADSTLVRNAESWEKRDYNQFEFNYTKTFENARKKFTIDMQYDFWNSDKSWNLNTQKTFPVTENLPGIRTSSIGSSKDFLLQTDLEQPLNEKMMLEVGLKAEKRSVITSFNAEQQQGDEWLIYDNINNKLEYDELIGSAYAQLSNKGKKFSYMLGLRSELTKISIEDRIGTYRNDKNYTRIFPTLNLGYQINESTSAQFSYSKRINRPSLWMLYPFNELTDLNAQYIGNPNLNPSYADVLEIGLLKNWGTLTFNPSLYYQNNRALIQNYTYRDAGVFYTTPVNIDREIRSGIELSLLYNPLKWLQVNAEMNAYNFKQEGFYSNQDFNFKGHILTGRLSTQIKYPKIVNVQIRYNYTGAQNNVQTYRAAIHNLDVGLSRNILKDKATLSFDGTNILDSRKTKTLTTGENYVLNQLSNSNAARYRLTFVYRFNLKDNESIRQAKSGNRN
ncbi:outer membrane beta-barrel family protein [Pedobacter nototheniae]|uniref:outer membrane beta-barrel family protein n=1 Tax=Pedobacter nototheniae TaxID=2488994 RepID=UPI0029302D0D|nr:outer membrane beta-barrel family protein [Pedobacter nototheniae]